jgi:uncharacterized protein YidB (DUF937 family)
MSGLDDLIGSITKSAGSGQGGGGIGDLLGGLLGGGGGPQGGAGGLEDLLGGMLGGGSGSGGGGRSSGGMNLAALAAALGPLLAQFLQSGGLSKLLQGAQAHGLSAQADSWVSTSDNLPIDAQEAKVVVGDDAVRQLAQQAGISEDEAADVLAQVVPRVVNGLTPNGQVPSDDELGRLAAQFGA